MTASWGGSDDWSRAYRVEDRAPDHRDDPRVRDRLAALAARHRPPQHVGRAGRESDAAVAGRLAALQAAHADLADRHAALVAVYDRLLADNAALGDERDAWRYRATEADRRADRAEAALAQVALGHLSWFVAGGAVAGIVAAVRYILGG